jgi:DNA-directed RNA polymerase specialized sigma24 family protein
VNLADRIINTLTEPVGEKLEQLQATLSRYCMSLTECSWDAEDLVQDTWLKALDTLSSVAPSTPYA